jgi:predicted nuclease of predicted toxin-antitoxin system
LRLLADENISPVIAAALDAAGYEVRTVVAAMPAAPDDQVMDLAITEDRVLLTEDKDFGELVFRHGRRPPGVIRLALPGRTPSEKAARLCEVLAGDGDAIVGRVVVVELDRVRSKALP